MLKCNGYRERMVLKNVGNTLLFQVGGYVWILVMTLYVFITGGLK